jgi:hypothetical protein
MENFEESLGARKGFATKKMDGPGDGSEGKKRSTGGQP